MTATEPIAESKPAWIVWLARLQFAAVVAAGWWLLLWLEPWLLPRGINRPLLFFSAHSLPASLIALILTILAAYAGARLVGRSLPGASLLIFSLLLALWCALRGVMDDWLILSNPVPGPGRAAPYLLLIGDYVLLTAALGALLWVEGFLRKPPAPGDHPIAPGLGSGHDGPLALLAGALTATIVIYFLAGPAYSATLRGQVWFALFVGFWLGVVAGRRAAPTATAVWFLAIPPAVGLLAAVLCAAQPILPAPFQNVNIIPAWRGLGRAIPAEMIGIGIATVMYTLASHGRGDSAPADSTQTG